MAELDTIKHYSKYLKSLETFAKSLNIRVLRGQVDGEGEWVPSRNMIRLDVDLSQPEEIATFLHELGHCLDDTIFDNSINLKLYTAYHAVYKEKFSTDQLSMVLKTERRAWKYGRRIASRLKIRLGKWFDAIEASAINGYKNI